MKGRSLDDDQASVDAVGAQQDVQTVEVPPTDMEVYREVPQVGSDPTYYERPMLKEPVWIWAVPTYFYLGGLGGASAILAAGLELFGGGGNKRIVTSLRRLGLVSTVAGTGCLIADLGRPERFLNMLRVLRITSPMSVGSWVLAANGATLTLAVGADYLSDRRSAWGRVSRGAGALSAVLSSIQCSYPAVLLSCTAVPVWQQARYTLPFAFVGSAMSSLGSVADLVGLENEAVGRFSQAGKVLELAAAMVLEKEVEQKTSQVSLPLRRGLSGALWKTSLVLTGASLALSVFGKSKWSRRAAGLCGTAGALTLRFASLEAGKSSAADPRASFQSQRTASRKRLPPEEREALSDNGATTTE